jgi:hypothetical protein
VFGILLEIRFSRCVLPLAMGHSGASNTP